MKKETISKLLSVLFSALIIVAACAVAFTYFDGLRVIVFEAFFYAIILIIIIALLVFRPNDRLDHKLICFSVAIAVFAIVTPALSQKDTELKQIAAVNKYNCVLSSQRISQILSNFSGGHQDYYSKSYIINPYTSNLEDLMSQASTTFELIGDLQTQNDLIDRRETVIANSYQLLTGQNFLQNADVEQQVINGYDYIFLTKAERIIQDTQYLQKALFNQSIPDCTYPSIPSKLCANMGSFGQDCWDI